MLLMMLSCIAESGCTMGILMCLTGSSTFPEEASAKHHVLSILVKISLQVCNHNFTFTFIQCTGVPSNFTQFVDVETFCVGLSAGFNSTLRQGNITHHEYIQVSLDPVAEIGSTVTMIE
jgi:hypothetical protein